MTDTGRRHASSLSDIGKWIRTEVDEPRKSRVHSLGLLTGLRESNGAFTTPNFERGLILDRLCELLHPRNVLELGTGRGLGALTMATAADVHGYSTRVTTIDAIRIATPQNYAIEEQGVRKVVSLSVEDAWRRHVVPSVRERVEFLTGSTTRLLPKLLRSGRRFDLIFIDAGHDPFDVIHDLAYSTMLLAPDGAILMDDFAPREPVGLGTVVAFTHAKRLFEEAYVFDSDGLVFGQLDPMQPPRGMVLLSQPRGPFQFALGRLSLWRVLDWFLSASVSKTVFPLQLQAEGRAQ
jgi:predicted O-methyltransferase YrrM